MKNRKDLPTILAWLPSIIIAAFFIRNAFQKIFHPNEITLPGVGNALIILVGICLLVATSLFLMKKTVIIGTILLAAYMTFVVAVHIHKGKPFYLTILIVVITIFAGYIRKARPVAK
jgi:Ca2+/H+ antiporter